MRKSKRGLALFELLDEPDTQSTGTLSESRRPAVVMPKPAAARRQPALEVSSPAPAPCDDVAAETVPLVEMTGNRIRVSVTSLGAAIVVFVAMVTLLASFEVGRVRGGGYGFDRGYAAGRASFSADTMTEIEAAQSLPPASSLVESLLGNAPAKSGARKTGPTGLDIGGAEPRWIRGYTYVVTQEFAADRLADAAAAKDFLAQHGVETALITLSQGSTQLISVTGYNRDKPAQRQMADQLLEKIHRIGAAYFGQGGGYKLDGYFRKLTSDRW